MVLLLRETSLHIGHIRSMAAVTEAGAIVYPPVPVLFSAPDAIKLSTMVSKLHSSSTMYFFVYNDKIKVEPTNVLMVIDDAPVPG